MCLHSGHREWVGRIQRGIGDVDAWRHLRLLLVAVFEVEEWRSDDIFE